jgi:NAD(P)H dehydrogenase (quinone)
MKVLIVYAHPNPKSFCQAVLQNFLAGLEEAGHSWEIIDLYKIHFDPVFNTRDYPSYVDESMPQDTLKGMIMGQHLLDLFGGLPRKALASKWGQALDFPAMARLIRRMMPRQIAAHQKKIAQADGLVFIAPIYWLGFPTILKGWFERVFTYGFAYALTPEGWQGYVRGRLPLLHHQKALVISTSLFREDGYKPMLERAMAGTVDEWALRYPGVKQVEHVYFYGVPVVDDETRQVYLQRAYRLGKEFTPCEAVPGEDLEYEMSARIQYSSPSSH